MLLSTLTRFLHDTRAGATALTACAITVASVAGAALIIDHIVLVDRRDILQSAADAASMSATMELNRLPSSLTDAEVQQRLLPVARQYAVLNVLGNVKDPDLTDSDVDVTLDIDRGAGTVVATVRADILHTILAGPVLGYSGPGLGARKSGVESVGSPVEVVLAIDVSGSMARDLEGGWRADEPDSRMNVVKRAAADLVSVLDPGDANRVAVGIVPWHFAVRLDAGARESWERDGWAVYPQTRRYEATYDCRPEPGCGSHAEDQALPARGERAWDGCMDEHRVSAGRADFTRVGDALDLPNDTPFAQAFYAASYGFSYQCLSPPYPTDYQRQNCYGPLGDSRARQRPAQYSCAGSLPSMLPLTSDRAQIDRTIAALTPVGSRTHSALGVLWAQRMLSHAWNGVWGGGTHPVDPDASAGVRKAIILLTDGQDTQCREAGDPACTVGGGVPRSEACDLAKAEGTEIFVIAAMPPREVAGELASSLRACSSEADKPEGTYVFINNATPENLEAAFDDIARQLLVVRRVF